ncbi:AfsR/SARP family transcriptional regulator [Myceligenerans pegani]|uniref:Tetratricopeptide repeat protein n=1 Tax=Myceligenerans pegani TaxID=2776917 RepID=A0ABR9N1H0_9MICO|nr:BTAD domain-containing putative transcriptional regulator [Myceligenerans sp. TRM 65318]MBE1876862.1 tetratricopeptide repeat protein [Myceligenerans sp. TRM 65318]MBE3019133.1 tetratricopeptide repeat protein [Myceligenerans sp. TRM 65318]
MDGPVVTVAVLGPFTVTVDGTAVLLPGRLRSLLAALAVGAGRPVTTGRLVDVVWGEGLPASPQRSLQVLVRRLRVALGDGTVETAPGGYRLALATERVDVARFGALLDVRTGDGPDAERRRLVDALALWRGAPFDGVDSAVLRTVDGPRLGEQHLAALARRIEIDLARPGADGRPGADLVAELRELTAEHPLQERFWGQLMTALVRAGRRDEALDAYLRLDQTLSDELGIGPGEAIRRLHREISPAAEPASWIPRQLPLGTMAFSGREEALATLDAMLGGRGPAPRVAVLDGPGGVGKTTTALHWAHRVAGQFPDGQLYANLRGFDAASAPVPAGTVARVFLEALGVAKGRIPASEDAQLARYRGIVAGRRMLVVLDNARDANQVRPLLPGSGSTVCVVTSRTSLTGLADAEGTRRISLGALTASEGLDLLAARVGGERSAAERDAALRIVERCAGLPLAIVIAAARVLARPTFPMSAVAAELGDGGARLDTLGEDDAAADVRSVFATSYRALSPRAARMFRLLGIHPGPDISAEATVPLLGDSEDAARRAMAELVRVNLVAEHVPGRYAMHDLVAEYARERAQEDEPEPGRGTAIRRTVEWHIGVALALYGKAWPERQVPDFVAVPGDVEAPGVEPPAWFHHEWHVLIPMIETARAHGLYSESLSLIFVADAHFRNFGEPSRDWRRVLAAVRDSAVRAGDRRAEAWITDKLASLSVTERGEDPETEALLRRTAELYSGLDDPLGLAFVHNEYAIALVDWGRADEAVGHAELSLLNRRRTGRSALIANGLNILAWSLANSGDFEAARSHGEQALDVARGTADPAMEPAPAVEPSIWDTLGFVHAGLGDMNRAIECYHEAIDRKRADSSRLTLAGSLRRLAQALARVGRWVDAREALDESLRLHVELGLADAGEIREELAHAAKMADGGAPVL